MSKKNKRSLKKQLRYAESLLKEHLSLFLNDFDPKQPYQSPEDNFKNFDLLLRLRWLIYHFINARLKLNPAWKWKNYFLELIDVEEIKITNNGIYLIGDVVWWAESKDAQDKWWEDDKEPHPTGFYKAKLRGDLDDGYWIVEPVLAKLRLPKSFKRKANYEIDFGTGSTYFKIRSK